MLEVTGDFGDGISTRYAVNEVVIQRQGAGMISVETYVNDQMVAHLSRRRTDRQHADRLDGLFAQRGRSGRRPPMRLPGALARRAPQPDDAPGRDSLVE